MKPLAGKPSLVSTGRGQPLPSHKPPVLGKIAAGGYPGFRLPVAPAVERVLALAPEAAPDLASRPGTAQSDAARASPKASLPAPLAKPVAESAARSNRRPVSSSSTKETLTFDGHGRSGNSTRSLLRKDAPIGDGSRKQPLVPSSKKIAGSTIRSSSSSATVASFDAARHEVLRGLETKSSSRRANSVTSSAKPRPSPSTPSSLSGGAAAHIAVDHGLLVELTEVEVLMASEGESLSDVTQLLYRNRHLRSLRTPAAVDFAELVSLRVLSLSHNELCDISAVASLPCLVELNVNHNKIKDLRPAFLCEGLRTLLAANNRVSGLDDLALQQLSHLSVFSNNINDSDAALLILTQLPCLSKLDISGNPGFDDDSNRYAIIRALPMLKELDGEALTSLDAQMTEEFIICANEAGFQERPPTAFRPKTAPAPAASRKIQRSRLHSSSPSRSRRQRSASPCPAGNRSPSADRGSRRHTSVPPETQVDLEMPPVDPQNMAETTRRFASHIEATRLRIRTLLVDCENLRRQVSDIKSQEPILGAASVRQQRDQLEVENTRMHQQVVENERLRRLVVQKEAEFAARCKSFGRPQTTSRPGSARPGSARPGSVVDAGVARPATAAAVDSLIEMSRQVTVEVEGPDEPLVGNLRTQNRELRRRIEAATKRIGQWRLGALEASASQPT